MERFVISRVHPIEEVDINLLYPTTPVEKMEYSQLYMGKKTLSMPEMHIQIVISELRQSDNDLWLAPFASGWPQPRRVKRRSKLDVAGGGKRVRGVVTHSDGYLGLWCHVEP